MTISLFQIKNFPNETTAAFFSIIFIIILIIELRVLLRYKKDKEDKNSLLFILFGICIPLISTILLTFTNLGKLPLIVSHFGIIVILAGFILRQYSISILGKFFTPIVTKHHNQKIIQCPTRRI